MQVKQRQGSIQRVEAGGRSAICQGMFKKETDITIFQGMQVTITVCAVSHKALFAFSEQCLCR